MYACPKVHGGVVLAVHLQKLNKQVSSTHLNAVKAHEMEHREIHNPKITPRDELLVRNLSIPQRANSGMIAAPALKQPLPRGFSMYTSTRGRNIPPSEGKRTSIHQLY